MFELPGKPETIGKTLDAGFRLYFQSFRYVVLFAFMFGLIGLLPSFMFSPLSLESGGDALDSTLQLYGAIFVAQLLNNIFLIAMVDRIHNLTQGQACSLRSSMLTGLRKFIPMIFLSILYTLAWVIGMFLFFIPGVFLSVAFIYSGLVLVTENRNPIDALGRSWDMVKNNWWRTMVIVSVAIMVYLILLSVLSFALGVAVSMSEPDSFVEFALYFEITNAVIVMLVMPLLAAIMITGFNDLVLRREGGDIEARIRDISAA